jgi:SNF2 family DNA or RNA helicase
MIKLIIYFLTYIVMPTTILQNWNSRFDLFTEKKKEKSYKGLIEPNAIA